MNILIAGGTGYLGDLLIRYFGENTSNRIYILTRGENRTEENRQFVNWDGETSGDWTQILAQIDVVINLAGKNINCRWTKENKAQIVSTRINTTRLLANAILQCENPPRQWLNASSVAVYPPSFGKQEDENTQERGTDFLSIVSQKWEETFYETSLENTIQTVFRVSMVLGNHPKSALSTLRKTVQLFGGGKAGKGKQRVSWIGELDFVRAIDYLIQNELDGAFNFCNKNVLTNQKMMVQLRKKYKVPFGFPAPEFLLKMVMPIMGTPVDLVLRSQNVKPTRLLENGFVFQEKYLLNL